MKHSKPAMEQLQHQGDESHLLREIVRTHQVLMNGFSRHVGMPASRFTLMRLLAVTPGAPGVMELARLLGINAAAVTRQVKELEALRLVRRCPDPRDGRRSSVQLTAKGIKLFAGMHRRGHELERALAQVLNPLEIATAVAVLEKLRAFIEELG